MKKLLPAAVIAVALVAFSPAIIRAAASFFVADNGYVSIGNSDPQAPLDVSGAMYSRLVTATSTTIDWNKGNVQTIDLASATTTLTFTNGRSGGIYKLILNQDLTGGRTVVWPVSASWQMGTEPTLSSAPDSADIITFVHNGSRYLGTSELGFGISSLLNSLVSYWKFDESSGNAADSEGSNTLTNHNSTAYASGKINNAADLENGSPNYFSISDGAQSGLNLSGSHTFSAWIKNEGSAPIDVPFLFSKNGTTPAYEIVLSSGASTFDFRHLIFIGGSTNEVGWSDFSPLTTGTWYHVVVTFDATTGNTILYVNGTSLGTETHTGAPLTVDSANGDFYVGTQYGVQRYWDGMIDEVGVWSRALTPTEVSALYNSGSGNQHPF